MDKIRIAVFAETGPVWRFHGLFRRIGRKNGACGPHAMFLTDLLIGIRFLAGSTIPPLGLLPEAVGSEEVL